MASVETIHHQNKMRKFPNKNSKFVYRRQLSSNLQSGTLIEIVRRKKLAQFKKINDYCFFYNKYGKCKKENKGCQFIHDPSRIAICTRFLQGSCNVKSCPFSHTLDKNKMPVCSHFLDGFCQRDSCPYRHVRVNPKAPFCKNFLKGHCPQGEECKNKHILICEEFQGSGKCPRGKTCPLSHTMPAKERPVKKHKEDNGTTLDKTTSKKPNNKINKIGILGLNGFQVMVDSQENCRSHSSVSRYFDPIVEEESNSPGASEQCSSTCRIPLTPVKELTDKELESKRQRLFQKVEALKRNYNIGQECQSGESILSICKSSSKNINSETPLSHCPSQTTTSIKLKFLPLPDILPDFIPLIMP